MRISLLSPLLAVAPLTALAETALVPLPALLEETKGNGFTLGADTVLSATGDAAAEATILAGHLRSSTGLALPVKDSGNGISLSLDPALESRLGKEGYTLVSTATGVKIVAATRAGLFHGGQTLLQLLPPEIFSAKTITAKWTVPPVKIEDSPRFAWRGFMLDESRHFFGVEHVKRLLDAMALHKLNVLHWHLTDDEGWRIEIKAYPKLTTVGAWRGSETEMPNVLKEDHKRYGGFYTQDQLREIVAYAKARHIDIMPEVDLPGHSFATVTAYPELLPSSSSDGVSAQGFRSNAVSPAREETYKFVETVFDELKDIFPFDYIHIGGDEVNHNAWKDDPQIKELMEREKLHNLHEVQVYFTRQLEKIFAARGKKIFGWNEVLDDRLDRGTGIMAWTGAGPGYAAASKGFPVVMVPGQHCYFDMGYPGAQGEPPSHWWAGPVDIPRVYAFDPLTEDAKLPEAARPKILGVHSALWCEFVKPWKGDVLDLPTYSSHADYKTWPRLSALAEVGWTPQAKRNLSDFEKRLGPDHLRRLAYLGINFRLPVPNATHKAGKLTIAPPFPGAEVRYTLDGSVPTESSPKYEKPLDLTGKDPAKLRARTFLDGRGSTVLAGSKPAGVAEWSSKQLAAAKGPLEFDLSSELTSAGIWRATFLFTGGTHAAVISGAELVVNGQTIATDAHQGRAGGQHQDNTWRFVVPAVPQGAKVILRAKIEGDGGKDSNGSIVLQKSDRIEPAAKVETTLGAYQQHTADKAADWNDDTHFWIGAPPAKDDTVTWLFEQPVAAKFAGVQTGERNGTKDQAVGAVLEYSIDGSTWKILADYAYGKAEAALPPGTTLKALRIRFTEKQTTWVMVQDPVLK